MYTLITTGKDLANEQKGKELKHKWEAYSMQS
jgi:hypothetical protein